MRKLVAFNDVSLDGYFAGTNGDISWAKTVADLVDHTVGRVLDLFGLEAGTRPDGGSPAGRRRDAREGRTAMIHILEITLTVIAALGTGLIAGVFFAFSAFVMTALGRLPPDQGIAAMQSINVAVLNPWFFAVFFGTAADCIVLAILALFDWSGPGTAYLAAGGAFYLVGCVLVTIVFNVPLNKALAVVPPDSAEGAERWTRYQPAWTIWNHVRTVGSLAAAASFTMAML